MEILNHSIGLITDNEIIAKILQGEIALFEVLIRRYNALLYKVARSYGLNHHDAEDMMQETHFTVYTQLESFRHEASYKTWLTKIMISKCYHKISHGSLKFEQANSALVDQTNTTTMFASSSGNNTEKKVINRELATVLEQCLQELPMLYRSVFILREVEGFSVAETAESLNISATNVKVRLNRAKALLQKQLENVYSSTELYDFHLKYCDKIVKNVFERIRAITPL